jgi:DNA-binding response OmpR family regulator
METKLISNDQHNSQGLDLDDVMQESPRKRVLIIDDEIESTTLMKLVLMSAGLDVVGAASGEESMGKASEIKPDVILLDLMMPSMDGWQTFENLRKITDAPIVFVSAKTDKFDIVRGLELGADDYVTKPFHPSELIARVQKVINRSINVSSH